MRGAQPATSAVPDFFAGSPVPAFLTVLATAKEFKRKNWRRSEIASDWMAYAFQRPCARKPGAKRATQRQSEALGI